MTVELMAFFSLSKVGAHRAGGGDPLPCVLRGKRPPQYDLITVMWADRAR